MVQVEEIAASSSDCKRLVAEGDAAFVDEEFEAAINKYTEALILDKRNTTALCKRAAAHIKLESYTGDAGGFVSRLSTRVCILELSRVMLLRCLLLRCCS